MPDFGITKGVFLSNLYAKALAVASNYGPTKGATPTKTVAEATVGVIKDIGPLKGVYDPKWAALFGSDV